MLQYVKQSTCDGLATRPGCTTLLQDSELVVKWLRRWIDLKHNFNNINSCFLTENYGLMTHYE